MNRILIAEDEKRLAAFIEKGLRKHGFTTDVAADGQQALQKAVNEEFQLVLLDLGLPITDGWTVLKELRAQGEKFPIIIVTALNDDGNQTAALNLGANDFVTKPFKFSDLIAKVKYHLNQN
ncbi:MAG: response regulator transcription factor [Cyanomargarita calcarea GSE-NOS-MK-12-04C]|jgi:DNA-binding response OmpR family regulator|uniref:Response regulator transcription factor n=1 Tax=Cyanomargarita calcarea GSE-NOS-MK-12-04C TaxID=2839659 RepID=A0A951QM61_9CYAN|nr:response regulator transcription factor [Cyanomargarita calcarea GSE-NOS-MK-12-04C]